MRQVNDLDKDDVIDVYKRASTGRLETVAFLQVAPKFTLVLCGKNQIEILKTETQKGPVRLYLDATGNVTRKVGDSPLLHHVLLMSLKRDSKDLLVPVAEMITDDSTSANIGKFLELVRQKVCIILLKTTLCSNSKVNKSSAFKALDIKLKQICNQIGTDNSPANINAILHQSGYKIKEYLDDCYDVFVGKKEPKKLSGNLFKNLNKNLIL